MTQQFNINPGHVLRGYEWWKEQNEEGAPVLSRCDGSFTKKVFFMLGNLCLYRFLYPVGRLNMSKEETRASLIWFDHQLVQTSLIFCWGQNKNMGNMIAPKRTWGQAEKWMCKTQRKHVSDPIQRQTKSTRKGKAWSGKRCGIHAAAYRIKTSFLSLAHLLSLLVICRLVGHWGGSSLTCRGIFGSAIHRATVLPPVLRGLSWICDVRESRP